MAMTLRLTKEQDTALALLAQMGGVSKHEAVIRAIESAAARALQQGQAREITASVTDTDMALLRKLSSPSPRGAEE
ncbi:MULTISPECIES: CopG family transcriptional regulator [Corynebacterium]|uniref:CopG family transcriptional regulator n=1 Tax=Corynebacterium TaxID=1716 RepID=UPI0008A1500D|nr:MULTISPECIES: CopG family transcriptional regulator [Corynebacterium]MBC6759087.1 CopG family transcriptional regulator [Corynebacterium sp. LK24]MCQ9166268.1 CopG family transcriptional regulator [Corynebacterium amycolatum]MCQ9174887.1 CopG family transcriptional regulator [Corynebacterium amycolatum]MCT1718787.1 CopG family transcriptional regulator [Corynebacterium amycolatum]OFN07799.1 CopG family transcriptional regulator [Corynebacterium sp. HMSC074C11]